MARPNPLRVLMATPLPTVYEQKLKLFRPSQREVHKIYNLLNRYVFGNKLKRPNIKLGICRCFWGMCYGDYVPLSRTGSYCALRLSDKWYCVQWFVTTLAHEMVHQYQWDVDRPKRLTEGREGIMSHGPSFYEWRIPLAKYDIPLSLAFSSKKWFETQKFL